MKVFFKVFFLGRLPSIQKNDAGEPWVKNGLRSEFVKRSALPVIL